VFSRQRVHNAKKKHSIAGGAMQKWEYMIVTGISNLVSMINGKRVEDLKVPLFGPIKGKEVCDFLNEMGNQGWEAVSTTTESSRFTVLLKRTKA
jgi:hypothetical protein